MFPLSDNVQNFRVPWMMYTLIAINVLVFLSYGFVSEEAYVQTIYSFGMIPAEVTRQLDVYPQALPAFATLLSSMFLHGDLWHLLGNMYFLFLFGDNVEEYFGSFSFLGFYLLTGIIAAIAHIVIGPGSEIPTVGASGAISGILGAYLVSFPGAQIRTLVMLFVFIQVIDIPVLIYLGLWFYGQFQGILAPEQSNIAFMAHIGGFVAGLVLGKLWPRDPNHPVEYEGEYRSRRLRAPNRTRHDNVYWN